MSQIDDKTFAFIVKELRKLPKVKDPLKHPHVKRDASWQTAVQMFEQYPRLRSRFRTATELDTALCDQFTEIIENNKKPRIRPAHYPARTTCQRLWGHVEKVTAGPTDLSVLLQSDPHELESFEPLKFRKNSPTVFLSHSLKDHHFAARVRLALAIRGVKSWIAEGDLYDRKRPKVKPTLFEGIAASIAKSDSLFVLVSSFSISSAWIDTEAQTALGEGKKIAALVDASDAPVADFMRGQKKNPYWLQTPKGKKALKRVYERFKREGGKHSRLVKFELGVKHVLQSLTGVSDTAIYPSTNRDGVLSSFDDLLSTLSLVPTRKRRIKT